MGAIRWFLEALLILFVCIGIGLISATACIGALVFLAIMAWTSLEIHTITPLGILQGVATVLVLLPHIRRYLRP